MKGRWVMCGDRGWACREDMRIGGYEDMRI